MKVADDMEQVEEKGSEWARKAAMIFEKEACVNITDLSHQEKLNL